MTTWPCAWNCSGQTQMLYLPSLGATELNSGDTSLFYSNFRDPSPFALDFTCSPFFLFQTSLGFWPFVSFGTLARPVCLMIKFSLSILNFWTSLRKVCTHFPPPHLTMCVWPHFALGYWPYLTQLQLLKTPLYQVWLIHSPDDCPLSPKDQVGWCEENRQREKV